MLVKTGAINKIHQLREQIVSHGYKCSDIVEKQYNYEFDIISNKQKVKLLVYFGKKGVSVIVQGDIESDSYKKIKLIAVGESLFDSNTPEIVEPEEYIGIDESGKGDFFGPLVIAAVYSNNELNKQLLDLGVKDSKLLTDHQIRTAAQKIKEILTQNRYCIISINPEKYNQLYESFKNLNKLLAWGHSKSIENLLKEHSAKAAISDKFGNESLILTELAKKQIKINLIQSTKAERFTAVAAASILARDRVLNWFNRTSKELKIPIPLGAGNVTNVTMNKIAEEKGKEILTKLVKLHFKNYVKNSNTVKG